MRPLDLLVACAFTDIIKQIASMAGFAPSVAIRSTTLSLCVIEFCYRLRDDGFHSQPRAFDHIPWSEK